MSLFNRSKKLLYYSGIYASAFVASTQSISSYSSIASNQFNNYLKQSPYNTINENTDTNINDNNNTCKILSETDVQKLFPMNDAIRIQAEAFTSMYNKKTIVPERIILSINENGDDTLFKPALNDDILGQKVVSVRPNNPSEYNLPLITGSIILWDKSSGLTKCLMDAQYITGRRTAAGSGLATDLFASSDLNVLTVFGSGTQAYQHIHAVLTVRNKPNIIYIINRNINNAHALKNKILNELNCDICIECISLDDFHKYQYTKYSPVISSADIICTCTNSSKALFDGNLLKYNVHINSIGSYKPNMCEIDENVIQKCYIFIDSIHAFYCGDLYNYVDFDNNNLNKINKLKYIKWNEIGEFISNNNLNQKENGKPINDKYENEMTLFESVGVAAQDLHSAFFVYQNAIKQNVGQDVVV